MPEAVPFLWLALGIVTLVAAIVLLLLWGGWLALGGALSAGLVVSLLWGVLSGS